MPTNPCQQSMVKESGQGVAHMRWGCCFSLLRKHVSHARSLVLMTARVRSYSPVPFCTAWIRAKCSGPMVKNPGSGKRKADDFFAAQLSVAINGDRQLLCRIRAGGILPSRWWFFRCCEHFRQDQRLHLTRRVIHINPLPVFCG